MFNFSRVRCSAFVVFTSLAVALIVIYKDIETIQEPIENDVLWESVYGIDSYGKLESIDQVETELAPFVLTPVNAIRNAYAFINLTRHDVVLDLGCGDGRFILEASSCCDARGVCFENDKSRLMITAEQISTISNLQAIESDIKKLEPADLDGITVVTIFLMPHAIQQIAPILLDFLVTGTGRAVLSVTFQVPGLNHVGTIPLKQHDDKPDAQATQHGHAPESLAAVENQMADQSVIYIYDGTSI